MTESLWNKYYISRKSPEVAYQSSVRPKWRGEEGKGTCTESIALASSREANGGNCPLTVTMASLEIDAYPMSFQKMGEG